MNNELTIDPGPKDPSVLHMQSIHRSSNIWKVGGGDVQRARRRNPNRDKYPPMHARMIPILTDLRFDGIARLTSIDIDWGLITALVERWRPETHTFHLPIGECTITLQDVSVLFGLCIDGDPVTGSTAFEGGWSKFIQSIFGEAPNTKLTGGRLQLSWLTTLFPSLPDDASDEYFIRYTQSYLLQLIAGILFTDHSGGQIHCMYIPLIQDFDRCRMLSWGAAVLAFLFRELCKSSKIGTEEIAGCILLLQIWAWTRLHTLAPVCRSQSLPHSEIWGSLSGPYGLRWCAHMSFTDTGAHVVSTYRVALDMLAPSHFIWQPYSDEILEKLPDYCRDDSKIWLYSGPLICFYIIEPHLPDRCLRQFGMIQRIPAAASYSIDLHKLDLKGKKDTNWRFKHQEYIDQWNSRGSHIEVADVGVGVDEEYDQWYNQITRRFHTRVGGAHFYMLDLLEHISLVAMGQKDGDIFTIAIQGKQVLEEQFYSGVCQDFPVESRRAKEIELRGKPKRIGHKGGRGGMYTSRSLDNDEGVFVADETGALIEDEGVHLEDDMMDYVEQNEALNHNIQIVDPNSSRPIEQSVVHTEHDSTQPLSHPTFDLLSPDENLKMPDSVGLTRLAQSSTENAETDITPPSSHPTFNLLTQSPQPLSHPPVKSVKEGMNLRPHIHEGPKCGTGGHKIVQPYKRRRLKKKYCDQ